MKIKITNLIISVMLFCFGFTLAEHQDSNAQNEVAAGTVVVPNAYSGIPGTTLFLGPLANTSRTYQLLINDSELISIQGHFIESISFRLPISSASDWPASNITYANFDIYLSGSVAPQNRSLTFMNNVVGIQKKVKSGNLMIPVNSYPSGGNPNSFGEEITFDSAYLYTGGHLLIEIRHDGFTGTATSVDAIGMSVSGYDTLFSACWAGNYTGTTGQGGNFTAVRITIGGISGIQQIPEIPQKFSLGQNYPNPFNPKTIINYQLVLSDYVSLKVYDILGNEIAILVNEKQNPGTYQFEFDGSNLTSEVYFYRIETESFTDTKKMLFLK